MRYAISIFFLASSLFSYADTALDDYLAKPEPAYAWTQSARYATLFGVSYDLRLVSQTWQGLDWTHQLRVIVPPNLQDPSKVILFVTGGDNQDGEPIYDTNSIQVIMANTMALNNRAIVALLYQVPNQPLFELREDALLAHTFQRFIDTEDDEWPILLPMTKSAIQAMTAIQEFAAAELDANVENFIVAGASKRGWTTWLSAAANDARIDAIVPIVIDVLNFDVHLDYQLEVWGAFSEYIHDYVLLGLPELRRTPIGERLLRIVDPYSYLERLDLPTHIVIATNDPYWPVDAAKLYFHDLPAEASLRYFPNVGHALNGSLPDAVQELSDFAASRIEGIPWPRLTWSARSEGGAFLVELETDSALEEVSIWSAWSDTRDFRSAVWVEENLEVSGPFWTVERPFPAQGYEAFFVQAQHAAPRGMAFTVCTEVFVNRGAIVGVDDWTLY